MPGPQTLSALAPGRLAQLPEIYLRLVLIHNGLWFTETHQRLGLEVALEAESEAWRRIGPRISKRMAPHRDFFLTAKDSPLSAECLAVEDLQAICVDLAKVWLALDGVWFQAVERIEDLERAMECNEAAWHSFAFIEARRIREFLDLGPRSGLEGLARALDLRLYAWLNRQSCHPVDERTLGFEMNECRVQTARERRGLPDYPCKRAGLIEYTRFAHGIDERLATECIGCPPDPHPRDWYCKWRFTLSK